MFQSSWTATTEAHTLWSLILQQEKPPQWEACTSQQIVALTHCNQRKPTYSNKDPVQAKIKNKLQKKRNNGSCCSVAKSYATLQLQGLQHARLPCPSLSPGVCSKFLSIESVMLSNHLILCQLLLLLPSIFPSIRVISKNG